MVAFTDNDVYRVRGDIARDAARKDACVRAIGEFRVILNRRVAEKWQEWSTAEGIRKEALFNEYMGLTHARGLLDKIQC